jgi:hypothetical protein
LGTTNGPIELPYDVNRKTVEDAYRLVRIAQRDGSNRYVLAGRRAAKARDPKLLLALQKGAQVLQKMTEEQAGPHGFDVGGMRVQHTEFQLCKNAYVAVDEGRSEQELQYVHLYGMAAILAGLV